MNICVSLTEETTAAVIDRMAELAPLADLFEVRADFVTDLDLLSILRARTRPIVLTCRPRSEGGRWPDGDPRRRLVLLEAVKRGFDYVDVEHRSEYVDLMVEKSGRGLIVSFHDLAGTPDDLRGLYDAMAQEGADIVKIAVTPRSIADVGRLLALAGDVAQGGGPPLVPVAMGPLGVATRILSGRTGAPFTYACPAAGEESAPGQLPAALLADLYRVRSITRETRAYGILGSDVQSSLSPVLHNRAFEARGVDAVYVPLQADDLDAFMAAVPALGLSGFSVTRPYKVDILRHLHEVEEPAAVSSSVNTVVVQDGALRGSTTDGIGVLAPLRKRTEVKGRMVVILGAGGAARAAAHALHKRGAMVTVLARDASAAAAVAAAIGCEDGVLEHAVHHDWDILINATPLGSRGHEDETPLRAESHRPETIVLDMVYDPRDTRFLQDARAHRCRTVDGLEMLLAQAAAQFETWTGLEAPASVMRTAVLGPDPEDA